MSTEVLPKYFRTKVRKYFRKYFRTLYNERTNEGTTYGSTSVPLKVLPEVLPYSTVGPSLQYVWEKDYLLSSLGVQVGYTTTRTVGPSVQYFRRTEVCTKVLSKVLPYMCRGFYPLLVVEIFKLSNAFRARVRNRVTGPADRTLPMILDFADENHISPS